MDNQHRKITNYRELSEEEVELMNQLKQKGQEFLDLLKNVEDIQGRMLATTPETKGTEERIEAIRKGGCFRWLAMAKTDVQTATMFACRAVALPKGI